jgi:hypothetical protein
LKAYYLRWEFGSEWPACAPCFVAFPRRSRTTCRRTPQPASLPPWGLKWVGALGSDGVEEEWAGVDEKWCHVITTPWAKHSVVVFGGVVARFCRVPPCVLSGTPAYPDPVHDPTHQLPLTTDILSQIVSNVMPTTSGAFMCVGLCSAAEAVSCFRYLHAMLALCGYVSGGSCSRRRTPRGTPLRPRSPRPCATPPLYVLAVWWYIRTRCA